MTVSFIPSHHCAKDHPPMLVIGHAAHVRHWLYKNGIKLTCHNYRVIASTNQRGIIRTVDDDWAVVLVGPVPDWFKDSGLNTEIMSRGLAWIKESEAVRDLPDPRPNYLTNDILGQ